MEHKKRKGNKNTLQSYLMLLPNLILFAVMAVYPILWAFRYMFFDYDGIRPEKFVGLANFFRVFRDDIFWTAVKNTFVYAGAKIIMIIPLALIIAILINNPKRVYGGVQALIFSPTIMSSAVMGLVFYLLFNVYNGEINRMLISLNLISQPINWLGKELAMTTVVIVAIWGGVGNYMVYFLAGLQQVPTDMYESADIDGATPWQKLTRITIPMLGPVLKTILMLAIISGFHDYQSIMVMTGGGPRQATKVLFLYMYELYYPLEGAASTSQFGYGAAVSVVGAIIVGIITFIYLKISKKLDEIY